MLLASFLAHKQKKNSQTQIIQEPIRNWSWYLAREKTRDTQSGSIGAVICGKRLREF